jgi:hypothetical protein
MKKALFLAVAAASFSFTSCGGDKAAEKQADAVKASANADAANMEAAADSTKKQGEQAAIEAKADTTNKM